MLSDISMKEYFQYLEENDDEVFKSEIDQFKRDQNFSVINKNYTDIVNKEIEEEKQRQIKSSTETKDTKDTKDVKDVEVKNTSSKQKADINFHNNYLRLYLSPLNSLTP